MVHNYTEIAVKQLMPEVLRDYLSQNPDTCTCNRCQEDILALTLNYLPPHYVATNEGEIFTKVSFDRIGGQAQVIAALINAIKQVSMNPRH